MPQPTAEKPPAQSLTFHEGVNPKTKILHNVAIKFNPGTPKEIIDDVLRRYQTIWKECGGKRAGIRMFKVTKNMDVRKGYELVEAAIFDNEEALRKFRDHPKHHEITKILGGTANWVVSDLPLSRSEADKLLKVADTRTLFERMGWSKEKKPNPAHIAEAIKLMKQYAAATMLGNRRAPDLAFYEAGQSLFVQPAIEAIIVDGKGNYYLHKRGPNEKHFGPNKVHILGGFTKPNMNGMNALTEARWMAQNEMGIKDIEYVAGPIAAYQWTRSKEHPSGWPLSQVYVFKAVGDVPERPDIQKLSNDELPPETDMIIGEAGRIHYRFLKVYQEWVKNNNMPCVDLNMVQDKYLAPADLPKA